MLTALFACSNMNVNNVNVQEIVDEKFVKLSTNVEKNKCFCKEIDILDSLDYLLSILTVFVDKAVDTLRPAWPLTSC